MSQDGLCKKSIKLNLSQTGHEPLLLPLKQLLNGQFFAKCAKIVRIAINAEKFRVDSWLCLKSQEWVTSSTQKKEFCSEVTAQTTRRVFNLLWPIALRHLTRRKKCDDFWLPSAESFPMVYNMDDFAAIIFRRYCTLT